MFGPLVETEGTCEGAELYLGLTPEVERQRAVYM
jgi:hypothetical protein